MGRRAGEPRSFTRRKIVDFTPDGAYAPYNWELFFHAPLLIANALSKNQRFEEARDWYHFIFNPIGVESAVPGGSPMSKYWITKPFFETTDPQYVQQRIENIMRMLAGDTSVPGFSAAGARRRSRTRCSTGAPTRSSRTASPTTARSPTRRRS